MSFWGATDAPNEAKVDSSGGPLLHLSQACLDSATLAVAHVKAGESESCSLDLSVNLKEPTASCNAGGPTTWSTIEPDCKRRKTSCSTTKSPQASEVVKNLFNGGCFFDGQRREIQDLASVDPRFVSLVSALSEVLDDIGGDVLEDDHQDLMMSRIAAILGPDGPGASIDRQAVEPWADLDHPAKDCYGRRPVFVSESMEVMVMTWLPGDCTAIHDHGVTEYGAVKMLGPGTCTHMVAHRCHLGTGKLVTSTVQEHQPGEVLPVSHLLMHAMANKEERASRCIDSLSSETRSPESSPISSDSIEDTAETESVNISERDPDDVASPLLHKERTMKKGLFKSVGLQHPDRHACTLHCYVTRPGTSAGSVTGGARVLDVVRGTVCATDGGVFNALPAAETVPLPSMKVKPDFATLMRFGSEQYFRLAQMTREERALTNNLGMSEIASHLFAPARRAEFWRDVEAIMDRVSGKAWNSAQWTILCGSLREAAKVQSMGKEITAGIAEANSVDNSADSWQDYARMYDALIGTPCIDSFMRNYLRYFFRKVWSTSSSCRVEDCRVLSVGCGTGCVERLMIDELGVKPENLEAFDYSPSMVKIARHQRGIESARVGDATAIRPEEHGTHDVVFAGLNVYQYLPHELLEEAFFRAAQCTKPGGYFLSDFVTPDHTRWYPNLMRSADGKTASLRSPQILYEEKDSQMYLQSDIINLTWDTPDGTLQINDSGQHKRLLKPMSRILAILSKHYRTVRALDAHTLEELPIAAETSPSTRYVVIAQK